MQWKICTSKVDQTKTQSKEIDLLKEGISSERREKETFRLENEHLKMIVNNEKEANKMLKVEINKNSASNSAKISELEFELFNEKMKYQTLQDKIEKLIQKLTENLDFEEKIKKFLQDDIDELKKDFSTERATAKKPKQELDCEKTTIMTVQDDNRKLNKELETQPNAMQHFLVVKEQENEDCEKTKTGESH